MRNHIHIKPYSSVFDCQENNPQTTAQRLVDEARKNIHTYYQKTFDQAKRIETWRLSLPKTAHIIGPVATKLQTDIETASPTKPQMLAQQIRALTNNNYPMTTSATNVFLHAVVNKATESYLPSRAKCAKVS